VLTVESLKIRHSLIALEIAVVKLGIQGLFVEDIPSLSLNLYSILLGMRRNDPTTVASYASSLALLLSTAMVGRKMGLGNALREMRLKKLDLEQLEMLSRDVRERESKISHQQSRLADLQYSLQKKHHSDEEMEVMKKAMEELGEARSDELKEVLIDGGEVKVERLLGKGGFGVVNLATYRGIKVAMKQLIVVNDESVRRFR